MDSVEMRMAIASPCQNLSRTKMSAAPTGFILDGPGTDSGRLVGATQLRDTLLKLIENQEIEGGTAWISERLVGRIWYLKRVHQVKINETDSLQALEETLEVHAGKWVPYGENSRDWFSVDTVLQDIRVLRGGGMERLDLWWRELGWDPNNSSQTAGVPERVLAEYFRRRQIVLKELVERSFSILAPQISSYTSLPERWDITLTLTS